MPEVPALQRTDAEVACAFLGFAGTPVRVEHASGVGNAPVGRRSIRSGRKAGVLCNPLKLSSCDGRADICPSAR